MKMKKKNENENEYNDQTTATRIIRTQSLGEHK